MTLKQLEAIVRWWQPRLGLSHWDITVKLDHEPFEGDDSSREADASTWRPRDYEYATVVFNPAEAPGWGRVQAHRVVVHELLHLVTRDIEFVLDQLDGLLHRDVDRLIGDGHRHAVENAIDRLAYRIVDLAGITSRSRP